MLQRGKWLFLARARLEFDRRLGLARDAAAADRRVPARVSQHRTNAGLELRVDRRIEDDTLGASIVADRHDQRHVRAQRVELFADAGIEHRVGLLGSKGQVSAGLMRADARNGASGGRRRGVGRGVAVRRSDAHALYGADGGRGRGVGGDGDLVGRVATGRARTSRTWSA